MPTLAELRTISKEHDLSTSGTKEQLMARIHKHQMTGCTRPHHRLSGRKSMTRRSSPRKSAGCGCGKEVSPQICHSPVLRKENCRTCSRWCYYCCERNGLWCFTHGLWSWKRVQW